MKLLPLVASATFLITCTFSQASIGFNKSDCAVYGNLIEESENHRVYKNHYVTYTFTYDTKGTVTDMEVRFTKGKRPSLSLMTACLPKPISKKKRQWRRESCPDNDDCIAIVSKDKQLIAHFTKERWNNSASVKITKMK